VANLDSAQQSNKNKAAIEERKHTMSIREEDLAFSQSYTSQPGTKHEGTQEQAQVQKTLNPQPYSVSRLHITLASQYND